jgi:predicted ATPase/DNA-binding winged helix-turn-helix (wHTH) protein
VKPKETSGAEVASGHSATFGPFRLVPAERRLERGDVAVDLGGRALDILIALVERAGEVVPKKELIARVWPDVTVDEGSLRFHLVALRKALGEEPSTRYVVNVPGQGYSFVAPVSYRTDAAPAPLRRPSVEKRGSLPMRPLGVVGRAQIMRTITERLMARRFVSVVGPGGIGKTTVALCVGHALLADFKGAVHFVDLAKVSDPALVAGEIASAIGLIQYASSSAPGLIAFLRDKRLLLLLDNCEHVIGEAASVAERIIREAPLVHVLATSRETLQVEGERVQRLFPLESPPEEGALTAVEAMRYPAVQFFVERAAANTEGFVLSDANTPIVVDICRKLDGIALAIELAAGGVEAYGLEGTAALLNSPFTLPIRGRRTLSPRQQTLRATLDWSYTLLPDFERIAIRRLAVFVGPFTIEAALSVVATNDAEKTFFVDALANLVSKSLVIADPDSKTARYRLLDTTRTYAHERMVDIGEADTIARAHAIYFRDVLRRAESDATMLTRPEWLATHGRLLGDVRAALEWAFSPRGDAGVGFGLAGASGPFLLELSLMSECRRWTDRAIATLEDGAWGTRSEMELRETFGLVSMVTRGPRGGVRVAFERALEIATTLDDRDHQMWNLGQLTLLHNRAGDFRDGLAISARGDAIARAQGSLSSLAMAEWMLAASHNFAGDQTTALEHGRAAVGRPLASRRIHSIRYGILDRCRALGAFARSLWLAGYPDQARRVARDYVEEAAEADIPILLCVALVDTAAVFVWTGDLEFAADSIDRLIARATEHSLGPYRAIGLGWKGELQFRLGDVDAGIALLRDCLQALSGDKREVLTLAFSSHLAEALAIAGEFEAALEYVETTLTDAQSDKGSYRLPESLRIKGEILASKPGAAPETAEKLFFRSLELARGQSALAWELRATTSLARLWAGQKRFAEARTVLDAVYSRFTEGFETADVRAAKSLLDDLAAHAH